MPALPIVCRADQRFVSDGLYWGGIGAASLLDGSQASMWIACDLNRDAQKFACRLRSFE